MLCLLLLFKAIAPPIIPSIDPNNASPIPARPKTEKTNTTIPHMLENLLSQYKAQSLLM